VAVGAICVREGRLLLVRRGRGTAIGSWAPPGGRVEPGETVAEAVRRELEEETGLAGTVTGLCGLAEDLGDDHHFVILDFWVEVEPGEAAAADDADEVVWAFRDDLARLPLVRGLAAFLDTHGVLDRLD
jgi:ADP-ribose pyrophosphatase YjhB (NUDIX family)